MILVAATTKRNSAPEARRVAVGARVRQRLRSAVAADKNIGANPGCTAAQRLVRFPFTP